MMPTIQTKWVASGLPNHPNRKLSAIEYITIHTTGNYNESATASAHARLQSNGGGNRAASWHYTVDADEIWQSFKDEQMCWHTETSRGNERSIGIEICVNSRTRFSEACEKAAWLTATLLNRHNLKLDAVIQHHNWSGKNCPAELRNGTWAINWQNFLALVASFLHSFDGLICVREAELTIKQLKKADIDFDEEHWSGVFKGDIRPNREWTKILTGRVIDAGWDRLTPKSMGGALRMLIN